MIQVLRVPDGHELGHFLLPWHRQSTFQCTAEDISSRAKADWEIEANQFAAEMLMPATMVKKRLRVLKDPELAHVLQLSSEYGTSVEMTARRVTELSDYACAVVFSKDNVVRYSIRSELFERRLCVRKGDSLPTKSLSREASSDHSEWNELDAYWWLADERGADQPERICEQTLVQEKGHKVTLVTYEPA